MHQCMNGTTNPGGEVHKCHSWERMPGEYKLHGWMVGTITNISCWGGWEWIMHVLRKQLPHSSVKRVERVGVRGTFLIRLAFLIKIIICKTPSDEKHPRGNKLQLHRATKKNGQTKKQQLKCKRSFFCRQAGRQTFTNKTKGPEEMLAGYMFFWSGIA